MKSKEEITLNITIGGQIITVTQNEAKKLRNDLNDLLGDKLPLQLPRPANPPTDVCPQAPHSPSPAKPKPNDFWNKPPEVWCGPNDMITEPIT